MRGQLVMVGSVKLSTQGFSVVDVFVDYAMSASKVIYMRRPNEID